MAEQFAFQKFLRQAGQLKVTNGLSARWLFLVDSARGYALARAAFAKEQDGRGVFPARVKTSITSRIAGVVKSKIGFEIMRLDFGGFLFQPLDPPAHLAENFNRASTVMNCSR